MNVCVDAVRSVTRTDLSPGGLRLSILAVSSELPVPLDSGGHLRTFHLLRSLGSRYRVRLVAPTTGSAETASAALEPHGVAVVSVPTAPRTRLREGVRVLSAAVRRQPYVLYRRHEHKAVWEALRREVSRERPDLLYLDHLDSVIYRGVAPGIPAVVDLHNVYSSLTRRTAEEQTGPLTGGYLRREARLLEQTERAACGKADLMLTVSESDGDHFRRLGTASLRVIPNGVDCAAFAGLPSGRGCDPPVVLFIGSLSWTPNVSAAIHLARVVMPAVRGRFPTSRLRLVGRDPSAAIRELVGLPGVEVIGWVPDMLPQLSEGSVLAVPLASGGGTRLKILEAFAAGLPVVSTPVGCEGLDVISGKHLLVVDQDHFAQGLSTILGDPFLGRQLAVEARLQVRLRYDWSTVGQAACEAVESVLNPGG
jgi:glycosyltransferase involved in cell wall biosynthesis